VPTFGGARLFGTARTDVADDEAFAALESGTAALLVAGPVAEPPPPHPAVDTAGTVEVVRGTNPNALTVRFSSPAPAWLFLSEKYYPGWFATIDDTPVAIHRANVAFRAVQVPAGSHVLEMRYRPDSARIGLAITLSALAGLLVAYVRGLRARKRGVDEIDLDTIR
jgi:hypothetical protein